MSKEALILMVVVQLTVIVLTTYFFIKVLRSPAKSEHDSYSENDDIP